MNWHLMSVEAVVEALNTSRQGINAEEARRRLATHGPNMLTEGRRRSPLRMFLDQFTDFMILVLLAAAVVSGLIGEAKDTIAIMAIVVLNAVIGFVQEYRAERALEALKAMAAPTATVFRDGACVLVPVAEVVPGDIALLEAGAMVPADLRLLEAVQLRADEAALTGESAPVEKVTGPLRDEVLPVGDRKNMAYRGTIVTYGRGSGVVVATGMKTEFGKIATLLQETGEVRTPLQRRLAGFGRRLALAALAICTIVFVAGIMRGEAPLLMFLTAVSLAVAAIPEAFPAVVTISLALGARKMIKKKALVRKLAAVETLGSVTHICSDKTGTLTMNRMRVEEFYCDASIERAPKSGGPWDRLLRAMALCNDARGNAAGTIAGDPTEVALFAAAYAAGVDKPEVEKWYHRVAEIPFDSERKCMTTMHRDPEGGFVSFTKGAIEVILDRSTQMLTSSGLVEIQPEDLVNVSERMAADGLGVLALGLRQWPTVPAMVTPGTGERELILLGFVGILDPPREEAREAVEMCRAAGIVPVMITGDHPITAMAIAKRLGMLRGGDAIVTGRELAALSQVEFEARVEKIRVYARVAPEQKLKIVRALQARGEIVAMTGDGVNDAPALKQADIGVAMGIAGTDVAREASSMILLDDNFASIVNAVEEGRTVYANIKKFITYIFTSNTPEAVPFILFAFSGGRIPLALNIMQILSIDLGTDILPALTLGAEPPEPGIMEKPPRSLQKHVITRPLLLR